VSSYAAFDVLFENEDGLTLPAALAPVHVYDVTGAVALADLTADANGHIPAGSLAVAAGSPIRFWVELDGGLVGYAEILTS
jgi:hypothetical protein